MCAAQAVKTSVTERFVQHVKDSDYETLSPEAIKATKKIILDTLGVAVAGTILGNTKPLVDLVKEWGGKGESTILVYGGRVPAPNAALVNGMLSVTLDYDDLDPVSFIHVSRSIVPPAFAIAESIGGVGGQDLIAAVAIGFDVASRLSDAASTKGGIGGLDKPGYFGAAAAVAKLLRLNEGKARNALALALTQIAGTGVTHMEGGTLKGLNGGLSSRGGLMGALMAERGMVGLSDPLEGDGRRQGYFKALHQDRYIPDLLTVELGKVYRVTRNAQKNYPCCYWNGAPDDATLALVRDHDIKPEEIAEVIAHCGVGRAGLFEPREQKIRPASPFDSQFSLPWSMANAIVYRKVGIDQFTEKAIRDEKTLAMAQKIFCKLTPEFGWKQENATEPAMVEIRTTKGKTYSKRVDFQTGTPENPFSVADKFRDCCAHAVKTIPQENVEKVIQMVENLEKVTDVGEIIRLLG